MTSTQTQKASTETAAETAAETSAEISTETSAETTDSGKAPQTITPATMSAEIPGLHIALAQSGKIGENLAVAIKPKVTELTSFLAYVTKGWATPTEVMNHAISDLYGSLVMLAQISQRYPDKAPETGNVGGKIGSKS